MNAVYEKLLKAKRSGRLGHALLLSRSEPLHAFSAGLKAWLQALLCAQEDALKPCGSCESCMVFSKGLFPSETTHPDFLYLEPESETGYKVEQIRRMQSSFALSRALGSNRVLWISQAEKLSTNSAAPANALLKILEEPRNNSYLVLSSSMPEAILPTIKSRAQLFKVPAQKASSNDLQELFQELKEEGWGPWIEWLSAGAPEKSNWSCPADDDQFWKNRVGAVEELTRVRTLSWSVLKPYWGEWDRYSALRVWDSIHHFDKIIIQIKKYAQPQLTWLNYKCAATEAKLWKQ